MDLLVLKFRSPAFDIATIINFFYKSGYYSEEANRSEPCPSVNAIIDSPFKQASKAAHEYAKSLPSANPFIFLAKLVSC